MNVHSRAPYATNEVRLPDREGQSIRPGLLAGPGGRRPREDPRLHGPLLAALLDPAGSAGGAEGPALRADNDDDSNGLADRAARHRAPFPSTLPPKAAAVIAASMYPASATWKRRGATAIRGFL